MTKDTVKQIQLKKYKNWATALFVLMMLVFVCSEYILKKYPEKHLWEYIRAFSEAAMVGALADWFAVTALFHHPLGLKIPHTNLIRKGQKRIGENLGNFVTENFLSPQVVKNQVKKTDVSSWLESYLSVEKNRLALVHYFSKLLLEVLNDLPKEKLLQSLRDSLQNKVKEMPIKSWSYQALDWVIAEQWHQKILTEVSKFLSVYLLENRELVRQKVEKESFRFIPKFIDHSLADKITDAMVKFFNEVYLDENHPVRFQIENELIRYANAQISLPDFEIRIQKKLELWIHSRELNAYLEKQWDYLIQKAELVLQPEHPLMIKLDTYLVNSLEKWQQNTQQKEALNVFFQKKLFVLAVTQKPKISQIISETVGNWQADELSRKLELEVGKDLQFIRINGTLVGGLVGLLIYVLSQWLLGFV